MALSAILLRRHFELDSRNPTIAREFRGAIATFLTIKVLCGKPWMSGR
jgi:hypothetical protein